MNRYGLMNFSDWLDAHTFHVEGIRSCTLESIARCNVQGAFISIHAMRQLRKQLPDGVFCDALITFMRRDGIIVRKTIRVITGERPMVWNNPDVVDVQEMGKLSQPTRVSSL